MREAGGGVEKKPSRLVLVRPALEGSFLKRNRLVLSLSSSGVDGAVFAHAQRGYTSNFDFIFRQTSE